eukprot:Tbor_TRINITY_DN3976_c0_g1::TRINITY_DN3976_c0_g1_i1::g.789::m.789
MKKNFINSHCCYIKVAVFLFLIIILTCIMNTGIELTEPSDNGKMKASKMGLVQEKDPPQNPFLRFLENIEAASGEWLCCKNITLIIGRNTTNINILPYTTEMISSSMREEPLRKMVEALKEVPPSDANGLPDIQLNTDANRSETNTVDNSEKNGRVLFADLVGINGDGSVLPVDNENNKDILSPSILKAMEGLTPIERAMMADDILFKRIVKSNWRAKNVTDIDFGKITPVHLWQKSEKEISLKWELLEAGVELDDIIHRREESNDYFSKRLNMKKNQKKRSIVSVACIYAGFLRDYKNMFRPCMKKECSKKIGGQQTNMVDSSKCDIYMSTWDIYGKGRYSVSKYDMTSKFDIADIKQIYGNRLAALHVQPYNKYERILKFMARYPRLFPQTRPVYSSKRSWKGIPEARYMIRINDYSQSYKHWCVVQLALLSGFKYDLFLRLRPDLRTVGRISNFRFALEYSNRGELEGNELNENKECEKFGKSDGQSKLMKCKPAIAFEVTLFYHSNKPPSNHTSYITANRLHTQVFKHSDFGFIGTPEMIQALTAPWFYCLMPPRSSVLSPVGPYPPIRALSREFTFDSEIISEYNLILWRVVFDSKWEIDDGKEYLRVSRRF